MAVHNGERFIKDAIDSIFAQTLPPSEVIIINDSSKDNTGQYLHSLGKRITVIESGAQNQSVSLNMGIRQSTCEFVAFLDHDDLWVKSKQDDQINALRDRGADSVSGGVSNFSSGDERRYLGPARVLGATTFKRATFELVGLLDETTKHHSNFNWWSRARAVGIKEDFIDREHLLRRIHESNSGVTYKSDARLAMIKEIRNHLRRDK